MLALTDIGILIDSVLQPLIVITEQVSAFIIIQLIYSHCSQSLIINH